MADDELDSLLTEQIAYYRTRAVEYDSTYPLDVRADAGARAELLTRLEELAPFGKTLELACGTGQWTAELARRATKVTAVDAASEALTICRQRVGTAPVHFVEADLFTWRPAVAAVERSASERPAPAVLREVSGGRAFRAVKVLYAPDELRVRLDALGWKSDMKMVGWRYFSASLRRDERRLRRPAAEPETRCP
jgi:SAM-dependent methyltransferase